MGTEHALQPSQQAQRSITGIQHFQWSVAWDKYTGMSSSATASCSLLLLSSYGMLNPSYSWSLCMYVAIEGVIGVGKTTLARLLQSAFNADILLEVFEENPFLSDFYADRHRYA